MSFQNYYRADASLLNHVDCDGILFTMSVALGDDCEFIIGQKTNRSARMSERSGKTQKITIKCGDAIFFDGGSVPHQVKRVLPGTAASWWEEEKVPGGSRCVLLFREQEESFYKRQIKGQGWARWGARLLCGWPTNSARPFLTRTRNYKNYVSYLLSHEGLFKKILYSHRKRKECILSSIRSQSWKLNVQIMISRLKGCFFVYTLVWL